MVTAPRGGRRPSAASIAGGYLLPPNGHEGQHQSLNPDSAFPAGFKPERRRNSYAAGVPIPQLLVDAYSPEMSPTLAQQLGPGQGGQYGSQHLLAPTGSFRRRLPPTPLELAATNGRQRQGSHEDDPSGLLRRTSSPRVLPTPPPQHWPPPFSPTVTSVSPPACNGTGGGISPQPCISPFERRRSIRRQLPAEPMQAPIVDEPIKRHQSMVPRLSTEAVNPALANGSGQNNNLQLLQRSSSTRSARNSGGSRSANLPPSPRQQQSLEVDTTPVVPAPTTTTSPAPSRLSRTASAAITMQANNKRRSLTSTMASAEGLPPSGAANKLKAKSEEKQVEDVGNEVVTVVPVPTLANALTPPPPQPVVVSAPTSPRDQSGATSCSPSAMRKFSATSETPSTSSSAVLTDLAAISALNLRRNGSGSMAHLLEQQHILRREFTAAPAGEGQPQAQGNSNSSSLSPSIEQLNCTAAHSSRSGSDAEIVADPSVLGFDPSLYSNGGASAACSGSAQSLHHSEPGTSTSAGGEDHLPRPRGLGLLHCTLQHFPVRKRLRVNVLKIEGLAGELRPDLEIQPFCKLTLGPGKKQQQQQSVIKRGRDAVFNQEFFFDNVATEEIGQKQLQIEVCHSSGQKLQKDLEIGEVRIPLSNLTQQLLTKKEVRIVEELRCFQVAKKLGKLHISTCIEKEARRLTINLVKAEELPKWGIVGAPDVQIRIKMQQGDGPEVVKSSRVLKSTTTAVYKEAVMFLISTKEADLARTKITISVHDLCRSVTGNDVIGSVYLGELATDKSELDQWKSTMDHWGKEYKAVHTLKGPSGQMAPDVHVTDVQDEDGPDSE